MISEGSCDSWSNDAENSALIAGINFILKCIQMEYIYIYIYINIHHLKLFTSPTPYMFKMFNMFYVANLIMILSYQ